MLLPLVIVWRRLLLLSPLSISTILLKEGNLETLTPRVQSWMWDHQITQVKRKHGTEMGMMTFSYSGPKEKGGGVRPFFTVLGQKESSVTYSDLELTWVEPDAAADIRTWCVCGGG